MNRDDLRRSCADPCPHPSLPELRAQAEQIVEWTLRDHETLPQQPVGRSASRDQLESLLREPLPEEPTPFEDVLRCFDQTIAAHAVRIQHPRFFAFVPSAPTLVSVFGDWLASAGNFFAGVWLEGAGAAQVELVVLDWFRQLLGMPSGTEGILTGGGSEANLTALVTARERLATSDRPLARLYVSAQRHWSIDRAARVMGLLPDQVRGVAVDERLRLSVPALVDAVRADRAAGLVPWAVVATAGTTNTGAIDPLTELAQFCRDEGLWLHVDAAYGWASVLDEEGKRELAGIELADSVTLDPHKWLAQGLEVGALLVRDGRLLEQTFAIRPEYLEDVVPDEGEVNFCDRGIALTRRFRAMKVWLSIKVLGLEWYRQMIRHTRRLALYAAEVLRDNGFEIVSPPQLSIVLFRRWPGDADRAHRQLVEATRATGDVFLSSTRLDGRVCLRFCFVNWRTMAADIECAVEALRNQASLIGLSD